MSRGLAAYLATGGLLLALYAVGGFSGWWKDSPLRLSTGGSGRGGSGWGGGFGGGK